MHSKIPVSFDPYYMSELSEIVHGTNGIKALSGHSKVTSNPTYDDQEQSKFNKDKIGCTTQLVRGLKPVVILGRCLGLIAQNDVLNKEKSKSKITFPSVVTAYLSLFLFINAILTIRLSIQQYNEDSKTLVRKEGFCYSGYAIAMFLVYFYQLFATKRLRNIVQLFKKANDTSILIKHQSSGKKWFAHFPLVCAAIIIITMVLGITENILYDVQRSVRDSIKSGQPYWYYWNPPPQPSNLEVYYSKTFKHWDDILPSSMSPVTMLFVILVKFCTFGWIYMDIVSIVLCRAVWEKLKIMEQCLAVDLRLAVATGRNSSEGTSVSAITATGRNLKLQEQQQQKHQSGKWVIHRNLLDDYQNEYLVLSQLIYEVQKYISPLILSNYFCNMYTIVVLLFHWMEPISKASSTEVETHGNEQRAYAWFAFLQFCFRVAAITYFASEVYQVSIGIKRKLQNCPNDQYTIAVQRLDTSLSDNPAGIRLLNSFMITRHYFAVIIGLIIAAEIILLQSYTQQAPVAQGQG